MEQGKQLSTAGNVNLYSPFLIRIRGGVGWGSKGNVGEGLGGEQSVVRL